MKHCDRLEGSYIGTGDSLCVKKTEGYINGPSDKGVTAYIFSYVGDKNKTQLQTMLHTFAMMGYTDLVECTLTCYKDEEYLKDIIKSLGGFPKTTITTYSGKVIGPDTKDFVEIVKNDTTVVYNKTEYKLQNSKNNLNQVTKIKLLDDCNCALTLSTETKLTDIDLNGHSYTGSITYEGKSVFAIVQGTKDETQYTYFLCDGEESASASGSFAFTGVDPGGDSVKEADVENARKALIEKCSEGLPGATVAYTGGGTETDDETDEDETGTDGDVTGEDNVATYINNSTTDVSTPMSDDVKTAYDSFKELKKYKKGYNTSYFLTKVLGGKLLENTFLNLNSALKDELTIDLNGHELFVVGDLSKVNIVGATAAITFDPDNFVKEASGESDFKAENELGVMFYSGKLTQEEIDKLPSGTTITLLDNYAYEGPANNPVQPKLFVYKNGVELNKNGFDSAAINYAVAYVNNNRTKTPTEKDIEAGIKQHQVFESVAQATQAIEDCNLYNSGTQYSVIHVLRDTKEKVYVKSNAEIYLDLNNHVITGDVESQGKLIIGNIAATNANEIGTGEITGELIYNDETNIELVHGIFDLNGRLKNNGLVTEDDEELLPPTDNTPKTSLGYQIADQWIVLENTAAMNVNTLGGGLELGYVVYEAEGFDSSKVSSDIKAAKDIKAVKALGVDSLDSDDIADLAVGTQYKAVVYLKGAADLNVRAFDFNVDYDSSILINEDGQKDVDIKADTVINKYTNVTRTAPGILRYTLATNNIALSETGFAPVAVIDFTINKEADKVYADAPVYFWFNNNFENKTLTAKDFYASTMASIHKIPFANLNNYEGSIRNAYDGVKLYDFAYAPEGYKLAIIADEHQNGTLTLDNGAIPVYYTEDEAYVSQSTNPNGELIKPVAGKKFGVYLAFLKTDSYGFTTADKKTDSKYAAYLKLVGNDLNHSDADILLDPCKYETVDLDQRDGTQVNDASLAYQMLKAFNNAGTVGSYWGYDPADTNQYIPAYQRLLAENNHDGKLYGTIEDINSILNLALDAPIF